MLVLHRGIIPRASEANTSPVPRPNFAVVPGCIGSTAEPASRGERLRPTGQALLGPGVREGVRRDGEPLDKRAISELIRFNETTVNPPALQGEVPSKHSRGSRTSISSSAAFRTAPDGAGVGLVH